MKKPCEIIKDLREDADLDQAEVAKSLGISQQTYSSYERGRYELPSRHLGSLAVLYHVNVEYLLGITDFRGRIEELRQPYAKGRTIGQLLSDLTILDSEGRNAVVEYVDFLVNKLKK